ncbi:hypothetical protein GY31_14260 [Lysinibacillus sphaericus]|nr:hypothetical protein GY31_14260 [Lysinibacillus sphaericus]
MNIIISVLAPIFVLFGLGLLIVSGVIVNSKITNANRRPQNRWDYHPFTMRTAVALVFACSGFYVLIITASMVFSITA